MKVLFITRLYPNEFDPRNGAVIHSQALELMKNGVEVEVISPIPMVPKVLKGKRKKWEEYYYLPLFRMHEGIKVWHPKFVDLPLKVFDSYRDKAIIKATEKVIDDIYERFQFDIVHAHMAFPDSSLGFHIKQKYNAPLVTTIRSTDMDRSIHDKKVKRKMKFNLKQSDEIIIPSPQLEAKLIKEFKLVGKHIGNGIYPMNQEDKKKTFFSQAEYTDKKIIISISNFLQRKGLQDNIKAMKELVKTHSDLIYLIIGDGVYRSNLESLIKEYGLEKKIFFLGDLPHKDAMEYLSMADIFSLPSVRETFGLVYLEAMYHKKAIILCKNNGIDGIVKHKESAMIIEPNDVGQIVESVNLLLRNKELKRSIQESAYEIVEGKYLWDKIGTQLIETYKQII